MKIHVRPSFGTSESAIGRTILIGSVPCIVVGVTQRQQGFGSSGNLSVYLPYSTVQVRFLGDWSLRSILLRVADDVDNALADEAATKLLVARHGRKDFFIFNTDDIRQTITATTRTLTVLIAAIAVISLIVGGIGVMNIMLVSVSERVKEIGVRMAVGARRSRYPAAVLDGGRAGLPGRRHVRRRSGLCRGLFVRRPRVELHFHLFDGLDRLGLRLLDADRHCLRLAARAWRGPSRPGRGPGKRLTAGGRPRAHVGTPRRLPSRAEATGLGLASTPQRSKVLSELNRTAGSYCAL